MTQYQSFPGKQGDSQSLDKLKALKLPGLVGKSFLDVGCNEGFFCGYALFDGANKVVGIDQSELFIARAAKRFSTAQFFKQSWDVLPSGPFDVITLLSAIHYANDQGELIKRIMRQLGRTGTFILEIGIAPGNQPEFVKVQRGIDERFFPTFAKVNELLADYAWKYIGLSVNQTGDPITRHVFHITHKQPVAYLLMDTPTKGKSTITREIFRPTISTIISGDELARAIADGEVQVSPSLFKFMHEDFSTAKIAMKMDLLSYSQHFGEWAALIAHQGAYRDFVYDGYIPQTHHAELKSILEHAGYRTVQLVINASPAELRTTEESNTAADKYVDFLSSNQPATNSHVSRHSGGIIDLVTINQGILKAVGWTIDLDGNPLNNFLIKFKDSFINIAPDDVSAISRQDVADHFSVNNTKLGFSFYISDPSITEDFRPTSEMQVFAHNKLGHRIGPIPISKSSHDESLKNNEI